MIGDLLLFGIGWAYLHIRYCTEEKRKEILKEHYSDSYQAAGSVYLLHFIGFILMCSLVISLCVGAISYIFSS
jgi:hypothetical protein